jgi:hypothetical protein
MEAVCWVDLVDGGSVGKSVGTAAGRSGGRGEGIVVVGIVVGRGGERVADLCRLNVQIALRSPTQDRLVARG